MFFQNINVKFFLRILFEFSKSHNKIYEKEVLDCLFVCLNIETFLYKTLFHHKQNEK